MVPDEFSVSHRSVRLIWAVQDVILQAKVCFVLFYDSENYTDSSSEDIPDRSL